MNRACLAGLVSAILLIGCAGNSEVLTTADTVEVYRIDGGSSDDTPKKPAAGETKIDGFPVIARGKDQDAAFARKLGDVLVDGKLNTQRYSKCFWPGVVFRFRKGVKKVDVVICYFCHNYYVGPPSDVPVRENASFNGSPLAARLVELAKEAFPDDKDIQKLE